MGTAELSKVVNAMADSVLSDAKLSLINDELTRANAAHAQTVFETDSDDPVHVAIKEARQEYDKAVEAKQVATYESPDMWGYKAAVL